jgi:hypothetical protein
MVWVEAEEGKSGTAGRFGLAWYEEEFFREEEEEEFFREEEKDLHLAIFAGPAAGTTDTGVKHYVLAA